jgi:hypothetical protein
VIVRRLLVAVLALLMAAQVVRTAAVDALATALPAQAARLWPGHPSVDVSLGLIAIAESARAGRPVSPQTLASIYAASGKAPLSPDPFLVRGVQAQMAGDLATAEQAFQAARLRDPRSLPARYFLADLYLRNGDARRGLPEIAVLARLIPDGANKVAPYVATYAQSRSNWPVLRDMFRTEPALESASLRELAANAKNADIVLALGHPARRNADSPWLSILVESLSKAGEYARARQIWSQVSGARLAPGALIFDPGFTQASAPPPFNWTLTSSAVGLAERQQGRGLHVMFYGQNDGVLASQLLVLRPGSYRLLTNAAAAPEGASSLQWKLVCARDNATLTSVPLDQAIKAGWRFQVSASCPAQRLELFGTSSDISRQVDLTIRSVELARDGAGA